ncbi:MAG TPA: hypothetical protein VFT26_07975, partial [Pyrinomonadaceae bacterium]|nr:hypothetical protein [Pyrinomonadaceae bacterium]
FARDQGAREIDQPGLVGDRQQGPADRDEHRGSSKEKGSGREAELAHFLAQGSPVDTENRRGAALVAGRVVEHGAEQGFFHLAQYEVVQVRRLVAVQVGKIIGTGAFGVVTERHFKRAVATGIFPGP